MDHSVSQSNLLKRLVPTKWELELKDLKIKNQDLIREASELEKCTFWPNIGDPYERASKLKCDSKSPIWGFDNFTQRLQTSWVKQK